MENKSLNHDDIKLVPLTQTQIDILLAILDIHLAESRESSVIFQSIGIELPENKDYLARFRKIYKEIGNALEQEKPKDIINAWTIPLAFSIINQPAEYYGTTTWANALFYLRRMTENCNNEIALAKEAINSVYGSNSANKILPNDEDYTHLYELDCNSKGNKVVLHNLSKSDANYFLKCMKDSIIKEGSITVSNLKSRLVFSGYLRYKEDDLYGWRDLTMAYIGPVNKYTNKCNLYLPEIEDLTKE